LERNIIASEEPLLLTIESLTELRDDLLADARLLFPEQRADGWLNGAVAYGFSKSLLMRPPIRMSISLLCHLLCYPLSTKLSV
jgi:hypothetical protein